MNGIRHLPQLSLLTALSLATFACGPSEAPPAETTTTEAPASTPSEPAASTPAPAASAAGTAGPRVFFVEPQDGATVKSPVRLRFGIENYELAAVPAGTVEKSRPNVGHHHVGVDTECLPPGTVIPKANPWVHFGDGKNEIEMQLGPGQHKLALQLGDDTHTTIEGLCSTITVNVVE
jgi:hypothetical protein